MKLRCVVSGLNLLLALLLVGCAAAASETVSVPPTQPPPVRVEPTATVLPPANTEFPTLVAASGPDLEVGSTYPYVDGATLVAVPAGEFIMGADGEDNPEDVVFLNDYWIYSTKVTNQQYLLCETLGKCTSPSLEDNPGYKDYNRANDPVVGVTHDQAAAYCSFVQGRLPTEAEWEKSARNPKGGLYPWGDTAPSCDLVNFNNCAGGTTNVVNYPDGASYYGSLGMAGNTFEWVADWYAADSYLTSPQENPQGPSNGTNRSVRSSSYASKVDQLSVTTRNAEDPQNARPDLGFRCVVDDPTYFAPFCELPSVYRPASTKNSSSLESCPSLDITQAQYCAGKLPLTNVTFVGPPDAAIDPKNCAPSSSPNLFTCQSPDTIVSITAGCQLNDPGDPACLTGYSGQDNVCVADGRAGQCLAGSYNASGQCCSVPAEQVDLSSALKVCPVGTFHSEKENACLPYPVQGIITVSLEVGFASCTTVSEPGGDNGGGSSTPTSCAPKDCGPVNPWSPTLCCCTAYFDPNTCQP